MNDDIIVPFIDLSTPHLHILFSVEWRMTFRVCVNGFLQPQTRDTDIKVTWLCDDSQRLSPRTNQSLQRSTLVLDISYALSLAVMFGNICVRNSGRDCGCDTGKTVVLESQKKQIAAHQHSPERTRTWLRRYGLLVYRCLRTQMNAWSSMPIRQP